MSDNMKSVQVPWSLGLKEATQVHSLLSAADSQMDRLTSLQPIALSLDPPLPSHLYPQPSETLTQLHRNSRS